MIILPSLLKVLEYIFNIPAKDHMLERKSFNKPKAG